MHSHKLSVAPMMAYTDRHFRYLFRLMTKQTLLYTEMVTANAIAYSKREHLIDYSEQEHPIALQLGGSEPVQLALAAKIAAQRGYDEINLNVGCPSERVQKGCFGAALMKEPALVAQCFRAMTDVVDIPVTIKTRIGVDEYDSETFFHEFIGHQTDAGCRVFIIHARKAWLNGLSPRENREIPPLNYDRVYRLKQLFPDIRIVINGGITDWNAAINHLDKLDGVMIGRMACANPYAFASADQLFFDTKMSVISQHEVIVKYMPYVLSQFAKGVPMRHLLRHIIPFFQNQPGAKQWRRALSDGSVDDRQLLRALKRLES